MSPARFGLVAIGMLMLGAVLIQWHWSVGFDPLDARWWIWAWQSAVHPAGLPPAMTDAMLRTGIAGTLVLLVLIALAARAENRTLNGGRATDELHGSARWARARDVRAAGLLAKRGVIVGGWQGSWRTKLLRHDGPEHVMVFAPTRSGKGVSLIVPTLLTWPESVFVLDIKGENHALTAGWRSSEGHRVLKFEPTAVSDTVRFNPLAEVRLNDGRDIADCQNIASMIVDPDGKGLRDYWHQEGWGWLSVVLLHVIYRVQAEKKRTASLDDVNRFVSGVIAEDDDEDRFVALLDDMIAYDHGPAHVNEEVRRGASRMKIKAGPERSGVHSSAITQLALYADPVIARNTETSDFRIEDLVNGDRPAALYFVVRPSDIDRLRPLVRILMNIMLRRLTERMTFEGGRSMTSHKHRLLLMLDEFTAIGKLEIFERALAFMAGYGLKAFVVVQDITQLHQAYGRDEAIMSNCQVRIAFAPNRIETAKVLSDMAGRTTVVQKTRSRSGRLGQVGSVSDALRETGRPLMTPDECMRLKPIETRTGLFGRTTVTPGEALIFVAGRAPIRGRQYLYFQDRKMQARAGLPEATREPVNVPETGARTEGAPADIPDNSASAQAPAAGK